MAYFTHRCQHCGIDYTPYGNPHISKYCTLRCQESAARKRKRERDKGIRPDMPQTAKTGGLQDYYIPPDEKIAKLAPDMQERIKRGEPAVRNQENVGIFGQPVRPMQDVLEEMYPSIKNKSEGEKK